MAEAVTSKQGRIYYRSPVTHRCGHTEAGPLTTTPEAADVAAQSAASGRCRDCRATIRRAQPAPSILHPYAGCRHYTHDEGCPLHGEMCAPEYVGPVRRSRR